MLAADASEMPIWHDNAPALTIRKELQWHCRQMLTSRLKTINSFDASAMVAVGIIVAQLLFG